jgi:hypothetical protein
MLKRFKATLSLIAGIIAGGTLIYFALSLGLDVPKSKALFISVALSAFPVPLIGVFALVAVRPVGHEKITDDEAGYSRHFAIASGGYTLSALPYLVAVSGFGSGRIGLGATLLGVYVLMVILPIRSLVRVRRTLEYRASQS